MRLAFCFSMQTASAILDGNLDHRYFFLNLSMLPLSFNTDDHPKNSFFKITTALACDDDKAAIKQLKARLSQGPIYYEEAVEVLHTIQSYATPSGWNAAYRFTVFFLESISCFEGAEHTGSLKTHPAVSLLLIKNDQSNPNSAGLWYQLFESIAKKMVWSDAHKKSLFDTLLHHSHPSSLDRGLKSGVIDRPADAFLENLGAKLLQAAYPLTAFQKNKSSGGPLTKPSAETRRASLEFDNYLNAKLPFPTVAPNDAFTHLQVAVINHAGRVVCENLMTQAGSLIHTQSLQQLVHYAMPQEKQLVRHSRYGQTTPVQFKSYGRSLGALFRSPEWDPSALKDSALLCCKASITANLPAVFAAAAPFCSWDILRENAAKTFGGNFIAQLERDALNRLTPKQDKTTSSPAPRARL